ncbi:hypothetical protein KAR91_29390 [Candidatus Pacearchaeota archaeon]|nr:hypothetical protein [Candidatus Pacearchaeota archaeon]
MSNPIQDFVSGIFQPAKELISEFIVDKDQANELQFKMNELYAESLNSAREHDKASYGIWVVDFCRGMVRPVITVLSTTLWVVAKFYPEYGIELNNYDYAIIGGVNAFWFGGKFLNKDVK